jgi:hypothetical protein
VISPSSRNSLKNISTPSLADNGGNAFIDLDGNDNVTIDNVGFKVDDRLTVSNTVNNAILEDTETGNLTITNSEFTAFNGEAISVVLDQGADADDTTNDISDNVFSGVSEAINLDAVASDDALDSGDSVTVSNNNVRSFSGTDAFDLIGLPSGVQFTFTKNYFDGGSRSQRNQHWHYVSERQHHRRVSKRCGDRWYHDCCHSQP